MITCDRAKCDACGLCVRICHEHCLALSEGTLIIDREVCSTCTQCIAVCPSRALSWNDVPPEPCDRDRLPRPEQLEELLRQRRTVREFRDRKIERALIEKIAAAALCAPTHNFALRAVVADDAETLALADGVILASAARIYRLAFRPLLLAACLRRLPEPLAGEVRRARPKLKNCLESRSGLASLPAALLFLVGDRRIPLSLESAQYALYNITLTAQLQGVASRNLVGNQRALNGSRKLRRRLGLARRERIFAVAGLGYAALRFSNKVRGRILDLRYCRP